MSVILVTGAGSGFGRTAALAFAGNGDTVYAGLRNPAGLDAFKEEAARENLSLYPLHLDVTDKPGISRAVERILDQQKRIDVLINNAGVHIPGALEDMPDEDMRRIMDINFFGALDVTRAVLPLMRQQGEGRIIMISSVGALIGRVNDAIYCASKSALEGASEALRYEVARFGIRVSVVEPGVFRTEIGNKYNLSEAYPGGSPYRELMDFRIRAVKASCEHGDDPAHVAQLLLDIVKEQDPAFRYPAGRQAEKFIAELREMDDSERDSFIRRASGIDWWLNGETEPAQ